MHVGSTDAPFSANSLDNLLFALHYQWAFAHGRGSEFRDIVSAQRKAAECSNFGFADAFRHIHKGGGDDDASRFVMRNWREISQTLQMSLKDGSGRSGLDAEL